MKERRKGSEYGHLAFCCTCSMKSEAALHRMRLRVLMTKKRVGEKLIAFAGARIHSRWLQWELFPFLHVLYPKVQSGETIAGRPNRQCLGDKSLNSSSFQTNNILDKQSPQGPWTVHLRADVMGTTWSPFLGPVVCNPHRADDPVLQQVKRSGPKQSFPVAVPRGTRKNASGGVKRREREERSRQKTEAN